MVRWETALVREFGSADVFTIAAQAVIVALVGSTQDIATLCANFWRRRIGKSTCALVERARRTNTLGREFGSTDVFVILTQAVVVALV